MMMAPVNASMDTFSIWMQLVLQGGALVLLGGILYFLFKITPGLIEKLLNSYRDMLTGFQTTNSENNNRFDRRNGVIVSSLSDLERVIETQTHLLQEQNKMMQNQTTALQSLTEHLKAKSD